MNTEPQSDTPRTDAATEWVRDEFEMVPADFARQLERDLSQAIGSCEIHMRAVAERNDTIAELERENAELRKALKL